MFFRMRPKKRTLLWELIREGGAGASYLFGTMHVQDMRAFACLEAAQARILECGRLALEFDLSAVPSANISSELLLPDELTLDQLIPEKAYAKLRAAFLRAVQLDINAFRHLTPMLASNLINERLLSKDMPAALDEYLWQFARRHALPVVGIETYEEQMDTLRHIPLDYQLQSLLSMGRNLHRQRRQLLGMAAAYERGDIYQLYQSARRSASGLRQLLLYRRNRIMAERIGRLVAEQPTFCAIGAGHLAGGKGVMRLLKQQGFRLRPVAC
ncbi:MAG: TraB/GumN family protein [Phaeodactylibacter sp.]|nr:TraB/GumN family protein [Phaeodactylibacter sp.]MCB9275267.1 TraB/GumN family protein [Lewinellaceae bacterium]